ncbi:MAG TPA: HAMP domain-containing sensor histidine kinase [Luteitalea sp.]|nr:HAMP domain-containing sensor histidine kinase [Luteitalea sp.]
MWVAFAAATGLIAYFVGRVSEALAEREHELITTRAASAKNEQMVALFALGAGAAHELATPLSTIRTAASELDRCLATPRGEWADRAGDYISVIRSEVDRCTSVLDHLSGRAASTSPEDAQVPLARLVDDLRYRLGESLAGRLDVVLPPSPRPVEAPLEALRQALIALLRNAFDASNPGQRVTMHVDQSSGLHVEVIDAGRGMDETEQARAGEPFYSTKPPGAGLGLGLCLVRAFVEQMGGTITLRSSPGTGTTAILEIPARSS